MKSNPLDKFKKQSSKQLASLQKSLSEVINQLAELQKQKHDLEQTISLIQKFSGTTDITTPSVSVPRLPDTNDMTPCSDKGIALGLQFKNKEGGFCAADLRNSFPAGFSYNYQTPYTWIAAWKGKNWIETIGSGMYSVNESFGK